METNIQFYGKGKSWVTFYRFAVLGMILFGSITQVVIAWSLADLFMGLMTIINLVAIALLGKISFGALRDYQKQRKEGNNPVFKASSIPDLRNVECWGGSKDLNKQDEHTG